MNNKNQDNNCCVGQESRAEYYPLLNHSGPRDNREPSCGFSPGDVWTTESGCTKRVIREVRLSTILYQLVRNPTCAGQLVYERPVVKMRPVDWADMVYQNHLNCYRDGKMIYKWDIGALIPAENLQEEIASLRRQKVLLESTVKEKQKKIDELSATAFCGCPGIDIFAEWREKVAHLKKENESLKVSVDQLHASVNRGSALLNQATTDREKYRAEALEMSKQRDEIAEELRKVCKQQKADHVCARDAVQMRDEALRLRDHARDERDRARFERDRLLNMLSGRKDELDNERKLRVSLEDNTKLLRRICNHFCISWGTGRPTVSKDSIPYDGDLHADIYAFMESGAGR